MAVSKKARAKARAVSKRVKARAEAKAQAEAQAAGVTARVTAAVIEEAIAREREAARCAGERKVVCEFKAALAMLPPTGNFSIFGTGEKWHLIARKLGEAGY